MERLRTISRTLRFRLAAWNALVVVLTALVTLLGLRQGVAWALLHEMDQILIEDLEEIAIAVRETNESDFSLLTDDLARKATGHRHHNWFVELRNKRGDTIWKSDPSSVQEPDLPATVAFAPESIDGLRIVQRSIPTSVNGISSIRVGSTLELLRGEMATIDNLVMVAVAGVLLIAPLCGYWLASRTTRTLGVIIQTAARLRPRELHERLPLRGSSDELDQLAKTINRLLDRIAEYLEQKRDFLANAAHELRTPLAAIRSSIEVALSGDRNREEYQDLLEDLIEQSIALELLVNQLLLLTETEGDQWKLRGETVRLDEVVSKSIDMFQGVAEAHGVDLHSSSLDSVVVTGNRNHLWQVVNNLIDNAIKYTPHGGQVDVSLRAPGNNGTADLVISDTGVGISSEDQARVFDRFFRADRSRTRKGVSNGTGLGLSICRAVITAHGGSISCESELGTGARFSVQIPTASPADAQ